VVKFKNFGSYSDCKRSGCPRKTTRRDDILIKRCVVKSPTCSAKTIRAELGETGSRISRRTISCRLTDEFGLKSRKPARKPRMTPAMKLKRLQFVKKYKDWTSQQWSRVLFSDETTIQQFASRKRTVRRPPGTPYNERFIQQTMKHPPSVMIWGTISTQGTAGLFFLDPGTTMNGKKYLELMKQKLELHMAVHSCEIFMHDGAPCHRAKSSRTFSRRKTSNCWNGREVARTLIQLRISGQNWRIELLRSIQPVFHRLLRPPSHPGFSTCPQSCAETSSRAEMDQGGVKGQRRTYKVLNVDIFYVKWIIIYKYDAYLWKL